MARKDFDRALELLEQKMLHMGSLVDQAVNNAVHSLARQDLALAQQVVAEDEEIDALGRGIEEECIKTLALQQPVARDLRTITAILRTVTDLERIGDHAVNIAEQTIKIGDEPLIKPLIDIPRMSRLAMELLHRIMEAFVAGDANLARATCLRDEEVDRIYSDLYDELLGFIMAGGDTRRAAQSVILLFVSRDLERIADHAVNIGENMIYLITGQLEHY